MKADFPDKSVCNIKVVNRETQGGSGYDVCRPRRSVPLLPAGLQELQRGQYQCPSRTHLLCHAALQTCLLESHRNALLKHHAEPLQALA